MIPFIIGSVFANGNIPIDSNLLVNSQPSRNTIQQLVEQNKVDTILLTQESIRKNPFIYVSSDKGNKKGNKNLAKYICWYDVDTKQVKTFLLDVCCIDENTDKIANAMAHSLKRIFPDNVQVKIYGQCTYSGGGGTKQALAEAMRKLNIDGSFYVITTYSLHNV